MTKAKNNYQEGEHSLRSRCAVWVEMPHSKREARARRAVSFPSGITFGFQVYFAPMVTLTAEKYECQA
jgi:hypothetical protein